MAKPLLSDELWQRIEPLLPPQTPRRYRYPGRKRLDDRKVLTGILFVLKAGIPWEDLPQELGCGCGMTCWRRLEEWQSRGVWPHVQQLLQSDLSGAEEFDWSRTAVESSRRRKLRKAPPPGEHLKARHREEGRPNGTAPGMCSRQ